MEIARKGSIAKEIVRLQKNNASRFEFWLLPTLVINMISSLSGDVRFIVETDGDL